MKVSEVNTPAVEKIEPRTHYSEEQLSELLGLGKKKTPIKQSDVFSVLQNIETRQNKKEAIPVRFDDNIVAGIDPMIARQINMWVDTSGEGPAQRQGKIKKISTWDGFKQVAKMLGLKSPSVQSVDNTVTQNSSLELDRIKELAGLTQVQEVDKVAENSIMDPQTKQMIPEKDYVMKYVMAKHPEATKKLLQTQDLMDIYDDELYMDLFDYFSEEMPYGTQKARDGDPVEYMQDELDMMGMFDGREGMNEVEDDLSDKIYAGIKAGMSKDEIISKYADKDNDPLLIDVMYSRIKFKMNEGKSVEEAVGDAMGMNKYGISAVHKDGKFYAFRNGKMVGGPFDSIEELSAFQTKSIENESYDMTPGGQVEYNFTKADFLANEDENMHTENAMELVIKFGTQEEIERMEKIMTAHNTRGHILGDEQAERDAMVRKYYPMLEDFKPHMMYKGDKKDYKAKFSKKKKDHERLAKLGYNHDNPETEKVEEGSIDKDRMAFQAKATQNKNQKKRDADEKKSMAAKADLDMRIAKEGYAVLPSIPDKYQKRDGLEGPIMTRSGKVVYYDNVEGKYYDPDTDMYMTYDEWKAYDPELPIKDDKSMFTPEGNTVLDRLRLIVKDKSNAKVQLDDGHMLVDLYTASAITQTYDKVNDKNKAKMADMMNTKAGLLKLTNAVFGMLNKQPKVKENLIRETYRDLIIKRVMPEKITKDTEMGDVIKDFYKSDAPQFKGKSKAKKRQMAIAAKLSQEESKDMTRDEEKALLDKVLEFQTKDEEVKDIEAKEKALQDIQMNKHTKNDPELQKELQKRKAELDRLKKLAGV